MKKSKMITAAIIVLCIVGIILSWLRIINSGLNSRYYFDPYIGESSQIDELVRLSKEESTYSVDILIVLIVLFTIIGLLSAFILLKKSK